MSEVLVLSATQVDTYRTCSLKWNYRHVEKVPEEQKSGALVLGIAVDVAVKGAIHVLRAGEAKSADLDPKALFRQAFDAEVLSLEALPVAWDSKGEERAIETGIGLVKAFLALPDLPQRLARIEAVDLHFELPVLDPESGRPVPGLALQGILDLVERLPDGRLRPLDLKTAGSRAGYDPEDLAVHLQAAIYVWALRQMHGDKAAEEAAFAIGLKLKTPVWEDRVVKLGEDAQKRALRTVLHAARAMDLDVAFPQPNLFCRSCPYYLRCRGWSAVPSSRDPFVLVA